MTNTEIDEGKDYTGYKEALAQVLANTKNVVAANLPIFSGAGYVSWEDVIAQANSPAKDISLKDGFAVKSCDVAEAMPQHQVSLELIGSVFAGGKFAGRIGKGQTVKVCSGAMVPEGADAIVSIELCREAGPKILFKAGADTGRNITSAGEDVKAGTVILKKGKVLLPARMGLLAAAGISQLKVYRRPRTALIAIGDEIVAPGQKLKEGHLYSSNMVDIGAWLSCFGIPYTTATTTDDFESIENELLKSFSQADVLITNGGALESERDLIVRVLDSLGWEKIFRFVRMGPGKGVSFGRWQGKPVFCLPGGPPSNEMAFLQLALPGILRLAGIAGSPFPTVSARLTRDINGRHPAWTEFRRASLTRDTEGNYAVTPSFETRRLNSMADTTCLINKPEGVDLCTGGK